MRKFITGLLLLAGLGLSGCGAGGYRVSSPFTWSEDRAAQYQSVCTTRDNYFVYIDHNAYTGPSQNQINDYWNSRNNHRHR